MRNCLFCSGAADSKEDALPRWITNQFKGTRPSEAHLERCGKEHSWPDLAPELLVRWVCRQCNNGWMSQLESQAKPFLQPLLMGEHCFLDMSGQATIALWSMKTAMVLEALDEPEQRAYTQIERERLRTMSAIPWRTSVWLAASVDRSFFLSSKSRHSGEGPNPMSGVSITVAFAHVVLQVLTIRLPEAVAPKTNVTTAVRHGPWDRATHQIWPNQRVQLRWPPPVGLNGGAGLDSFAERFSTTMLNEGLVDSLAI